MTAGESAARILALVPWLLQRPGAGLAEAAAVVGADVDVVRRELTMLCYCGGPGLGGGSMFDVDIIGDRVTVHMAPGLAEPLRLSPSEAIRLVLSLTAVADVVGVALPGLASALDKLRDAAGLDAASVSASVDADHRLADLQDAIATGRVVDFDYRGRKDDIAHRRHLDPWHLEFTRQGWYLHGHDHDRAAHRVFRTDRIQSLDVTDGAVTTEPPEDLPTPRWEPPADAVEVHLALVGNARVLGDEVALTSDVDMDGMREVRFMTDSLPWAAEAVAAAGAGTRVLGPPELATLVAARAARGLAAYDTHSP